MKILRKTWRVVTSLFGGILATTDSPGTPVYCTEVADKLLIAADALRRIECLTHGNCICSAEVTNEIHQIAQKAWRETQK